jgi:thioredoxin
MPGVLATSPGMQRITNETFDAEVLRSPLPVLLEFTAHWCGPCRALAPILERVAAENERTMRVRAVDQDAEPALATRFGVRALPTVIAFKDGREVGRHVGVTTKEKLVRLLG